MLNTSALLCLLGLFLNSNLNAQNHFYTDHGKVFYRVDYDNCTIDSVFKVNFEPNWPTEGFWSDFTFDKNEILYLTDANGRIFTVDTITGDYANFYEMNIEGGEFISGITSDHEGNLYQLGGNGNIYKLNVSTGIESKYSNVTNGIVCCDLTFFAGELYFTVYHQNYSNGKLHRINLEQDPISTEVMSFSGLLGGLSTNADSCQSNYIVGGRLNNPNLFYKFFPIIDSLHKSCAGIFPNPNIGIASGSTFKHEYLGSLPPVRMQMDSAKFIYTNPCTREGRINIPAYGGIDTLLYSHGGQQYSRDSVFTLRDTGWHFFYVKDSRSCFQVDSFYFQPPGEISLDSLRLNLPACAGNSSGSIIVSATGGFGDLEYAINGGTYQTSIDFGELSSGTYLLSIRDTMGCILDSLITLAADIPPDISATATTEYCLSSNASITVSSNSQRIPLEYSMDAVTYQPSATFSGLSAGTYTVHVRDSSDCIFTESIVIDRQMDTLYTSFTDTSCLYNFAYTDTLELISSEGCDSIVYVMRVPGNYIPVMRTSYMCDSGTERVDSVLIQVEGACDSLIITSYQLAFSEETILTVDTCSADIIPDKTILLSTFRGCDSLIRIQYSILPLDTVYLNSFSCDPRADESSRYINQHGCDSLVITQYTHSTLQLNAGADQVISYGDTIVLNPQISGSFTDLLWEPPDFLSDPRILNPVSIPLQNITYKLTLTDQNGCKTSDSLRIIISQEHSIFVPDAFSPNADGINDTFRPFTKDNQYQLQSMRIHDRWGNQILDCKAADCSWDGKFRGIELQPGIYVYALEFISPTNEKININGEVVLVR